MRPPIKQRTNIVYLIRKWHLHAQVTSKGFLSERLCIAVLRTKTKDSS